MFPKTIFVLKLPDSKSKLKIYRSNILPPVNFAILCLPEFLNQFLLSRFCHFADGFNAAWRYGGAPLVRTEKVRTGKCQDKKLEKVRTDFVLTVLVPKQGNVRTEDVRKEFVLTV